jgi:hypothetical protein
MINTGAITMSMAQSARITLPPYDLSGSEIQCRQLREQDDTVRPALDDLGTGQLIGRNVAVAPRIPDHVLIRSNPWIDGHLLNSGSGIHAIGGP